MSVHNKYFSMYLQLCAPLREIEIIDLTGEDDVLDLPVVGSPTDQLRGYS